MTTPQRTAAQRDWAHIVDNAIFPQQWALIAQATADADAADAGHRQGADAWADHALRAYEVMINSGCKRELNQHAPTAAQVMELLRIRESGPDGLRADRIPSPTRAMFLRRGWVTTTAPSRSASDWAAQLHLTPDGMAQAISACCRSVQLRDPEALALTRVAAAGPDGLVGPWPGTDNSLRVARQWKLVNIHDCTTTLDKRFMLTDAGRAALARWQGRPRGNATPTTAQAALLAELIAGAGAPGSIRATYDAGTYDRCELNGWIRYARRDEDRRSHIHITETGRAAHSRFTAAPPTAAPQGPQRLPVAQLRAPQQVRLANRRGWRNLGAQWVTLARDPEWVPGGGGPAGYRVWVDTPDGTRQYTDAMFGRSTRFEVKP